LAAKGMDRVSISVGDLKESLAFYRDWIGMEVVAEEVLPPREVQALWNLPQGTEAMSVLLRNEPQPTLLELLEFRPHSGTVMRADPKALDYGLYGLSILVRDLDSLYRQLTARGYRFTTKLVRYKPPFAAYEVVTAAVVGPDHNPIYHFERLVGGSAGGQGSYVELNHIAEIVPNVERARKFYGGILGLRFRGEFVNPGGMDEMFDLAPGDQTMEFFYDTEPEKCLVVNLVWSSKRGRSLAGVARPPNAGEFMTSFPVDDLEGMMDRLKAGGFNLLSGPLTVHDKRHGERRAITVEGPADDVVELFEV